MKKLSALSVFSKRIYTTYKCTINSTRMNIILMKYYNTIIKWRFYLKSWLKVLDIILDKGKGLVLGKLWIIQLIKADFQLLMKTFLQNRNNSNIKQNNNISKFNFGSRRHYSINDILLEKRLVYNTSMWIREKRIYMITDLVACYNR